MDERGVGGVRAAELEAAFRPAQRAVVRDLLDGTSDACH
ncbi:hypothetical protein P3T35_002585 [Kitasatospora sp. GP30]|nr:hypothetical protein [Kitasatospora sp. GP30]